MPKAQNLIGKRFGRLLVVAEVPKNERPAATAKRGKHWLCQCDCGKQVIHYTGALNQGDINSCGCLLDETKRNRRTDETGNKYGKLTVICQATDKEYPRPHWICECECGNIVIVHGNALRQNRTQSCGCLQLGQVASIQPGQKFGKLTILHKAENKNYQSRWTCQCECGSIITTSSHNLLRGNSKSCGCVHSWGEETISKILTKQKIKFSKQYSFSDLKFTRRLRFDFALLDKQNNLIALIEFQGIQHYDKDNKYYTEHIVKSDRAKKEYCKKHNIKLFEIKYDENIEDKLAEILKLLNLY